MTNSDSTVDKGWAWVVLIAAFCNTTLLGVLYPSVTIFYVKFLDVFCESRSYTSWLGSLNTMCMFMSASLSGFILPNIGPRNVLFIAGSCLICAYIIMSLSHSLILTIISYGMLAGTGFGFMLTGGVAAVTRHFQRHLYKATSISFVGGGIGTLIYGPLLENLISSYGWRGATLIYAGLSAHVLAIGFVVLPNQLRGDERRALKVLTKQPVLEVNPSQESFTKDPDTLVQRTVLVELLSHEEITTLHSEMNDDLNGVDHQQAATTSKNYDTKGMTSVPQSASPQLKRKRARFSDSNFWCMSYIALTWGFTITTFVGIFKDLVNTSGMIPYFQLAATISGVGNIIGRIVVGFLSFDNVILCFAGTYVIGALTMLVFTIANHYWILMSCSLVVGLFLGATFLMVPTSVGAVYGRKDMAVMYGFVLFGVGITSWIGPYLIGYLRDLMGDYNSGLYVLATIQLSGAVVSVILKQHLR